MFKPILIGMLLATCALVGGSTYSTQAQQPTHYPKLISGQMPLYPSLARTAHITGTVELQITVQKGSVIEVQVKSSSSPHLTNPSISNIKTWQFDAEGSITFLIKYVYEIKGKQTAIPENPRVELDLPHLVRVIARPFKPTSNADKGP
ncbi:MAG TPA: energy transducer TonB [Pyrinomonadaceae bacterium]|nr:energy transducer TonB [Pyrinomonadaceae bacterium]